MTADSYASAGDVLEDRIRWATARLRELLVHARQRGWVEADPTAPALDGPSADGLRAAIDERLTGTGLDVRTVPLEWLRLRLGLAPLELDALWLLAAIELDPGVARLAHAFGLDSCPGLSIQLLRRLLPLGFAEIDELARLGLVERATDHRVPGHLRFIRAADRIAELAAGELRLDPEVARIAELVAPIASSVPEFALPSDDALLVATGIDGSGRATLLRSLAAHRGKGTLDVRVAELAHEPDVLIRQLRAIVREAHLFDVIPLLRDLGPRDGRSLLVDAELLRRWPGLVLATSFEAPAWVESRPIVVHAIAPIDAASRAPIWRSHLPEADEPLVEEVAARYPIAPGAIAAAARNVRAQTESRPITLDRIHAGLRDHLGQQLGPLARRIACTQSWDDLVLPEAQVEQLVELVARVQHRGEVLERQGFGGKLGKGTGLVALFSGEPGTGKTMVAGILAASLGIDLYQVDLSAVVSKYIGETEKGLAKLFDVAEAGHVILLFDEADALFARRSEVRSSNDRYANLETNYLLQRLEAFSGITILTTNHETSLDDAFRRRIAVHVRFPMPDPGERAHLWEVMFPPGAPVAADVDVYRLARELELSGGHIKNAVLRAAYLAASAGSAITMDHLVRAARAEYDAMGRILTTASSLG